MSTQPGQPDPSPYIERLHNGNPFHREAAAWTLGELGDPKATRPLAGSLLREIQTVEETGYLQHAPIVRAVSEAIRRIGSSDALYALMKALCILTHSKGVDRETVEEIIETIAAVGGPNAVREAADRVVACARECRPKCPGLDVVGGVLLERLGLCGDAAVHALRRIANGGPDPLKPYAEHALADLI